MRRRVAITGLGILSPVGLNLQESWANLLAGKSGIGRVTRFDPEAYPSQIAGEVKGFDPDAVFPKREQKKVDLFIQYAVAAAIEAVADSGLTIGEEIAERTGPVP